MTDLIVGAAANYQWETSTDCTYQFVVSMRRSGYQGRCVFIVSAPIDRETKRKYDEYGVELRQIVPKDEYDFPHVFRYRAIPDVIDSIPDLRYVLALDVKDIIFQSDPTKWLEKNLGNDKIVGFNYDEDHKDSKYARELFTHVFGPEEYKFVADRQVCGVGIVCGLPNEMSYLAHRISNLSEQRLVRYIENSYVVPDQQAYNYLLARKPWSEWVRTRPFSNNEFVSLGDGNFDYQTGVLSTTDGAPYVLYHHSGSPDREAVLREVYK